MTLEEKKKAWAKIDKERKVEAQKSISQLRSGSTISSTLSPYLKTALEKENLQLDKVVRPGEKAGTFSYRLKGATPQQVHPYEQKGDTYKGALPKGYAGYGTKEQTAGSTPVQSIAQKKTSKQIPEAMEETIGGITKGVENLTQKVETEGVTPTQKTTGDVSDTVKIQQDQQATFQKTQDGWMKKFEDTQKQLQKTQDEAIKKQQDLFTKMGETANQEMMDKFEETQKTTADAFKSYFDQQADYLKDLQDQPSAVENLEKFRKEQGLPQIEKELAQVDQSILDVEGLLVNLEQDIRARTEGLPVSEAAARRLQAMESKPLTKQMDELLRSRQRVASGLQAKQRTVKDFMTAQQEDVEKQRDIAGARLGFEKERAEFKGDIAEQSYDLFTKLQDRATKIHELSFDLIRDDVDYKNELTKQGFDFFSQMMAQQKADINDREKFEQELIKEQLKADLKTQNPSVKTVDDFTDRDGNITMVTTYDDGTQDVIQLGKVGKEKNVGGGGGEPEGVDYKTTTVGGMLGLDKTTAKRFDEDVEAEIKAVYSGKYGKEWSREKALNRLISKYQGLGEDVIREVLFGSDRFHAAFPDGYEKDIQVKTTSKDEDSQVLLEWLKEN